MTAAARAAVAGRVFAILPNPLLAASIARIEQELPDDAVVLDVGGWAKPLRRANWVIDLMPYETRGLYGDGSRENERFSAETWVQRDICAREPWPFADDQFDFAVCAHTLEDVRDPVWVCSELVRVARAGYVEVPSRLEEQAWGLGGEWTGWSHHHWLVDVSDGAIRFVFKPHVLHGDPRYRLAQPLATVLSPEERVQTMFWEGGFEFEEKIFFDHEEFDDYLAGFVAANRDRLEARVPRPGVAGRLRGAAGRLLRRA
jgi:Methyltransferase domain